MKLEDSFGRTFDYLRISLTDRCNLRCFYCMPEKGVKLFDRKEILTLEEIEYLVYFFNKNFRIDKIRFTGGEPLLRRGIENLIKNIRKHIPDVDLNITTNGILLKEKAKFLKDNNIKVNVSLDTLKEEKFKKITGFYSLRNVIEGIDYAVSLKIPLKINTVVLKNINDDEIFDLIDFAGERNILIRFIEFMPLSGNGEWKKYFISEEEIKRKIKKKYELVLIRKDRIAEIYKIYEKNVGAVSQPRYNLIQIGFISTISNPFCNTCSRLRITSDGKIVLCLFDKKGYDIKKFLRPEIKEEKLLDFLKKTVKLKPQGFIRLKDKILSSEIVSEPYVVMRKLGG